jgi:hypothetical protein
VQYPSQGNRCVLLMAVCCCADCTACRLSLLESAMYTLLTGIYVVWTCLLQAVATRLCVVHTADKYVVWMFLLQAVATRLCNAYTADKYLVVWVCLLQAVATKICIVFTADKY